MLTRYAIVLSLPILLAACASEAPQLANLTTTSALTIGQPTAGATPGANIVAQPQGKTMSDRVLTAIALERVTGMKPDPARFVQ